MNKTTIKAPVSYKAQFCIKEPLCDTYTKSSLLMRKGTNFIVTEYKETSEHKFCHLFVYKHNGFQTRAWRSFHENPLKSAEVIGF